MPVYDMKCPKCGKQSTEYAENKWQCLHCGNKFIYKEESPHFHTNINLEASALFDVEPYDPSNEAPFKEPYLKWHALEQDVKLQNYLKRGYGMTLGWGCVVVVLIACALITTSAYIGSEILVSFSVAAAALLILVAYPFILIARIIGYRVKAARRRAKLNSAETTVGHIALCPFCKKEHSRHYFSQYSSTDPETRNTHCISCGKQFALVKGKPLRIREES